MLEPLRRKNSSVTETRGLAESKAGGAIRESVTMTCSRSFSSANVGGANRLSGASRDLPVSATKLATVARSPAESL